jgi:hypothetical protein
MQTDEEEVNQYHVPAKYLGNGADKRDMSALGREQVLRVKTSSHEEKKQLIRAKGPFSEKLRIHLYSGIWLHSYCDMGGYSHVGSIIKMVLSSKMFCLLIRITVFSQMVLLMEALLG